MSDLISRADALALFYPDTQYWGDDIDNKLLSLPSAEQHNKDAISREGLLRSWEELSPRGRTEFDQVIMTIPALPSADAVQGWRKGKPTEQGNYMVTLDSFGHKRIDLFYYGKPMMPNRKVRGKCWYRSDDEWGDVVYDDTDILAWMPLPTPYKGGAE